MARLRIGVAVPGDDPVRRAQRAEAAGLDHVSFPDMLAGDGSPTIDPLVTAAAVAGGTQRIGLEFGVLAVPLRPLVITAAQLLTVQHVAAGRVVLGLGVGGFAGTPLWDAVGVAGRRGAQLDAALDALPRLLRGEAVAVKGDRPVSLAPPVPVPPLLVGGSAGPRTYDRVVTRADGWFPSLRAAGGLARDITALRELAGEGGRPAPRVHFGAHCALGPDAPRQAERLRAGLQSFGLSDDDLASMPLVGPAGTLAEQLVAYADAGVDSVTLVLDGADWDGQLGVVADAHARIR